VGVFFFALFLLPSILSAQVTTGAMSGVVTSTEGEVLVGATVTAVHEPSQTQYGAVVREGGSYNIRNIRIGGPYTVTVRILGHEDGEERDVYVNLNQTVRSDFALVPEAIEVAGIQVFAEQDPVLNSHRTGAATYVSADQVVELPSIRRSTRDLTRLDPRSDGNFSFGGKNWLYNNISLDGSYFNNPFGLDDPAPGGQTASEPVPFDAIEAVQVSIAPFDIRQSGFTGAAVNSVTKSGTNQFTGTAYTFTRNESFIGDKVSGDDVLNPDLSFNQSGFSLGGPLKEDKAFFFVNYERIRRDDPGSDFVAGGPNVPDGPFVSRVQADDMLAISQRLLDSYGYVTGPFAGYINETNSDKFLGKLDWNVNDNNHFIFRYNRLRADRAIPPHPFAISINNTGRGPNENSLPFQNSGYAINNELDSYVWELNTQAEGYANRFFTSYNRFRDFRDPNSVPFPTLEIGVDGVTYTTVGHEPFSINNVLNQDVFQMTEELSFYSGNHVYTVGGSYERFQFDNSFNLFFYGVFAAPPEFGGTSFSSLEEFFDITDPDSPNFRDFNAEVEAAGSTFPFAPFQTGQVAFFVQDEYRAGEHLNLTYGLRIDIPQYYSDLTPTPEANAQELLDENGNPETIVFDEFPDTAVLWSPRFGFNWDASGGERTTQIRGGTGVFSGRPPFVWLSNQVTNPGSVASVDDLKWPQVWRTNVALDQMLPDGSLLTLELLYGDNINDIFIRNAGLDNPIGNLPAPDGRVRYDPANSPNVVGDNAFITDNTGNGYDVSFTTQIRKIFDNGLSTSLAYNFTEAKDNMDSTEIAAFIFGGNPVQGNPNNFDESFSQFGHRHRITGAANYRQQWSDNWATSFGLFFEAAEGGFFTAGRTSKYSYTYLGDLNGDGESGNDLIYIPRDMSEMHFEPIPGGASAAQQATAFETFIRQDPYLSEHRGEIAERNGGINPWFTNLDLRILQDFIMGPNTLEVSLDILNFGNLINSDWGVREVVNSAAKTPLAFNGNFDAQGNPLFQFPGTAGTTTFIDDISVNSRWQIQLGFRYIFN
jgi:hypothetical protein